jgi:hypothetical protein
LACTTVTAGRQVALDLRHQRAHAVGHLQRVGRGVADDAGADRLGTPFRRTRLRSLAAASSMRATSRRRTV